MSITSFSIWIGQPLPKNIKINKNAFQSGCRYRPLVDRMAGVCFPGGRGHVWHGVVCMVGGMCGRGHAWEGGMCGRGHAWGACMVRGCAWSRGHVWHGACVAGDGQLQRAVRILLECILVVYEERIIQKQKVIPVHQPPQRHVAKRRFMIQLR